MLEGTIPAGCCVVTDDRIHFRLRPGYRVCRPARAIVSPGLAGGRAGGTRTARLCARCRPGVSRPQPRTEISRSAAPAQALNQVKDGCINLVKDEANIIFRFFSPCSVDRSDFNCGLSRFGWPTGQSAYLCWGAVIFYRYGFKALRVPPCQAVTDAIASWHPRGVL